MDPFRILNEWIIVIVSDLIYPDCLTMNINVLLSYRWVFRRVSFIIGRKMGLLARPWVIFFLWNCFCFIIKFKSWCHYRQTANFSFMVNVTKLLRKFDINVFKLVNLKLRKLGLVGNNRRMFWCITLIIYRASSWWARLSSMMDLIILYCYITLSIWKFNRTMAST